MKFLHAILPNLCIALNVALIVVVILDQFNPMMGFLRGWAFLLLFAASAVTSVAAAVCLYASWRRKNRDRESEQ